MRIPRALRSSAALWLFAASIPAVAGAADSEVSLPKPSARPSSRTSSWRPGAGLSRRTTRRSGSSVRPCCRRSRSVAGDR